MNSYLALPLVQVLLGLILLPVILKGRFHSPVHRLFSLYIIGLVAWGMFIFLMRSSPTLEQAYFWDKWVAAIGPLWAVILYHFSVRFTGVTAKKMLLPSAYVVSLILFTLAVMGFVVSGMQVTPYGYAPIAGPVFMMTAAFGYTFYIMSAINFRKASKKAPYAEERNRSAYIFAGLVISMVGAAFDALPLIGLPLYPGLIIGNVIFIFLTTVAIVRYNLLDIRIILRKGVAYVLVSAMITGPFIGVFYLVTSVFAGENFPSWVYFVILLILAFVLPQLWVKVQGWVDKWFYRERYDYLKALYHFSSETQRITDLEHLGSTLVGLVSESLQASGACLLVPSPSEQDFVMASSYRVEQAEQPFPIRLPVHSPLIQWMRRHDDFVSHRDLGIFAQLQALPTAERQALQEIGAELCIPIKTMDGELVGVLILEPKRSQQLYSAEDKQLLTTIVGQMAMSLDNARLFQEVKHSYQQLESTQEYLVQSERLRALGQMSSGIAHDFNNVLTGVLGRAQLALGKVKEEKVRSDLEIIEQAALDAAQMVRRLQDFARVRTDLVSASVDLNKIVKGAVKILEPRLSERRETEDAAIETNLCLDEIPPVKGNDAELREVLVNIMINAMEAMPHGGKLSISTEQHNDSVAVSISDTGTGMTGEVRNKVFEPFFTTKGQQGLGMGLSVVYGIVKRHGGDINVSSKPKKGSTFNVVFPIALEDKKETAAHISWSGRGNATILVIDDDKEARDVISEILTGVGYTVDIAASGEEGLASAKQKNYDLVVTDLGMPGISGQDVAKAIKRDTPKTPVILITGWGVQVDPIEQGVDGVIAKPFDKEDILIQIAQLLNTKPSNGDES